MMKFTKMHGLGNDYLYVYSQTEPGDEEARDLSIRLSDRHFGAGSDGMIWILPSRVADFKMRIFNADGSEAKMCGNGIRCVGKYVYDKGYTQKTELKVETLSGVKTLTLFVEDGRVSRASVEMGKAVFYDIMALDVKTLEAGKKDLEALDCEGDSIHCFPVSMGNPHAVIFTKDAENAPLTTMGAAIEHHPAFPGGVNVEFVQVVDRKTLRMRVWERGSGVTMACGTGACASAAAAVRAGYCSPDTDIQVILDGGSLTVRVAKDHRVLMTGPAATVYEGETED